jgi:hypothetical protein
MKRRLDMRRRFYVLVFFRIRQAPLLLLLLACGRRSYPLLSDVPTRARSQTQKSKVRGPKGTLPYDSP